MGCPACNPELTQKQLEFQNSGRLARKGEPIVFTIRLTSIEQVRPGSVRLRFLPTQHRRVSKRGSNGFPGVPETLP